MMDQFNPNSVIGKRVHLEVLLDWDLVIPICTIRGLLPSDQQHRQLNYVVEFDSGLTFSPHRRGLLLRRRPEVTVKNAILSMRRIDHIEEELHGTILSELSAPILYYMAHDDDISYNTPMKQNLDIIGPVRVRITT